MTRAFLFLLLIIISVPGTPAGRGELTEARINIRKGKDLARNEQVVRDIIASDTLHRLGAKPYKVLIRAIAGQMNEANKNLFLARKRKENVATGDSAAFFGHALRLAIAIEQYDSARTKGKHSKSVSTLSLASSGNHRTAKPSKVLRRALPNIYAGGIYYLRKANYKQSFDFLDTYLRHLPLWEAASLAVYAAGQTNNAQGVLRHKDLALRDTTRRQYTLRATAEAYYATGDMSGYLGALRSGAYHYPKARYFYPRLIDYYNQHEQPDSALAALDKALLYDQRPTYQLARIVALYDLARYDQCATAARQLTTQGDTLSLPYYYAGASLLKLGRHRDAELYFEIYRKMEPAQKDKWAPALYDIYLKLNEGDKFDEIDKITGKM